MKIKVANRGTLLWDKAKATVQKKYQHSYDAIIDPNPHHFFVALDEHQEVIACSGITFADSTRLFSEQYLDNDLDSIIQEQCHHRYARHEIAEIGSLVSNDKKASLTIIKMTPLLSWCIGAKVLVCTITPKVAGLLKICDIDFQPICLADPNRLQTGPQNWGSYYDSSPSTGLIHVANHRALFQGLTSSLDFVRSAQAPVAMEVMS